MACLLFEHPPWAPGGQAVSVAIRVLAGAPRLAVIQDARRELPRSGFVQHAMFNLVPLAGAGRVVAHIEDQARVVGEGLQRRLPGATSRAIAATAVGRDQQFRGSRVSLAADVLPPGSDGCDGEVGRVVVDAQVHEARVVLDVVDAVRNRLATFGVDEVVDAHGDWLALGVPFATCVLEVADQLLLLGVDGDHRLPAVEEILGDGVDVSELCVAIRVLCTLDRLPVRLEAVTFLLQQLGDGLVADLEPLVGQFSCESSRALASPPQRRHRVTSRGRLDESVKRLEKLRLPLPRRLTARPGSPHTPAGLLNSRRWLGKFYESAHDRSSRQPGGVGHQRKPSEADTPSLHRRPQPSCSLVELSAQRLILRR